MNNLEDLLKKKVIITVGESVLVGYISLYECTNDIVTGLKHRISMVLTHTQPINDCTADIMVDTLDCIQEYRDEETQK